MSTETAAPTPTTAAPAPAPYVPKTRVVKVNGEDMKFVSRAEVTTTNVSLPDGTVVKNRMTSDYLLPDTTAETVDASIDKKLKFIGWVARLQEAKETGAGVALLDKHIDKLAEAPNERLIKDDGTEDLHSYLKEYEVPSHRGGLSENKVVKELGDLHKTLGELFIISQDKNPETQAQKITAAGYANKGQVVSRMEETSQRITKLSKTLAEIKQRKVEREARKAQKEAKEAAAAKTAQAAAVAQQKAA